MTLAVITFLPPNYPLTEEFSKPVKERMCNLLNRNKSVRAETRISHQNDNITKEAIIDSHAEHSA